jgi:alpha-1,6-mannosyltransferase
MRILQVANFVAPSSGGIRTVLEHLARGYSASGHEVVQIVPGRADEIVDTDWGRRVIVSAMPVPGTGYRILTKRSVTYLAERVRPDRIEVHDRSTLRGLGRWAGRRGIGSLVVSHERLDRLAAQWLPDSDGVRRLAERSNAELAASFDSVLCTTSWAAEEFQRLGVGNLHLVRLGVDLDAFASGVDPAVRARFAPDGAALLVMASRLSKEKRPDLALAAVDELQRRGVPVVLVVAGDGPLRDGLTRRATRLPVHFAGHLPRADLAALLASADVALAPGPVETFGLAALEALACGTPVIGNESSAIGEVLGTAGITADGTAVGFADAVEAILQRPERRRRQAARTRAERFDWADTVRGFQTAHGLSDAVAVNR